MRENPQTGGDRLVALAVGPGGGRLDERDGLDQPSGLLRDGVPLRYVARYPVLAVLAALWAPIRLVSSFAGGRWFHTPHGEAPEPETE